jgi:ubiquinone/menaquinone biosynthesis C-methylase UbiE
MSQSQYIFDNAAPQTAQRFSSLELLFDSWSMQHLDTAGITKGWHCLEVGGGSGSLAGWMAQRVDATGTVLVTDIDVRYLTNAFSAPNIEVREHNIVTDPLPQAAFDLIHERLVLIHIPERAAVLRKLVSALKTGGWLVIEEFDAALVDCGVATRQAEMKDGVNHMSQAMGDLMAARGANRNLGRELYGLLIDLGLTQVRAEGSFVVGPGGSTVTNLTRANFAQVRDEAVAAGLISADEADQVLTWMNDPSYTMCSPTLITAWGRRQ